MNAAENASDKKHIITKLEKLSTIHYKIIHSPNFFTIQIPVLNR